MTYQARSVRKCGCERYGLNDLKGIRFSKRTLTSHLVYLCLLINQFVGLVNAEPEHLNVRLTQSSITNNGRLDVQKVTKEGVLSRWGAVCDNSFGDKEAQVVCRQLGFSFGIAEKGVYRDRASLFVLDDVICTGNESELSECRHSTWLEHHCVSYTDFYAGVCCSNETSFGENINGSYISHCRKTWTESTAICLQIGSHISDESFQDVKSNHTTYWSSQIYTPWIALIGCFKRPGTVMVMDIKHTVNSPGMCVQLCKTDTDTIFGLSGSFCYCLNNFRRQKKEMKSCDHKCPGDIDQSCGNGLEYMSVYTTVSEQMFVQYTAPYFEKQCALLQNTRDAGKKRLKSENCETKQRYVCEHYAPGLGTKFFAPGGSKVDMRSAREMCNNLSTSFAGWDAVNAKFIHLTYPSWLDVSRYRVSYIQQNDSSSRFVPQYCVVTSMDTTTKESTSIVDCKTRHLFTCEKDKQQLNVHAADNSSSYPSAVYLSSTSSTITATIVISESSTVKTPVILDTEAITVIIIVSCSCLLLLTLCVACICLCKKRWRKLSAKQSVCSGSNTNITGSELLSNQSEKEINQVYSNTYDTIRDSNEYIQIIFEKGEDGDEPIQEQQNSPYIELPNVRFQNTGNASNENDNSGAVGCLDVNVHYIDPRDAIETRKTKVKNVKSNTSYTYPYDSLCKSLENGKKTLTV